MNEMIPSDLLSQLSPKWLGIVNSAMLLAFVLGRAYNAIVNGGGLRSIWSALIYGKTPPAKSDPAP